MSAPAWDELEALFHAALARAPAGRAAFLAERCAGRPDLLAEVEALLRAHDGAASALAAPAVQVTASMSHAGEGRPPLVGQQLGSYRILSLLGAGGMGEVYRALDTKLNRPVAIKFLSEDLADTSARRRFQREAQLASSLNHPHILTVHDAGEVDDRQYLVTEFVDGGTLMESSGHQGAAVGRYARRSTQFSGGSPAISRLELGGSGTRIPAGYSAEPQLRGRSFVVQRSSGNDRAQ